MALGKMDCADDWPQIKARLTQDAKYAGSDKFARVYAADIRAALQRVEELERTDKWHANERYKAEAKLANSEEDRKWMEAQIRDLEAKLARVVEALENEPDPLKGAILALAAAKGE